MGAKPNVTPAWVRGTCDACLHRNDEQAALALLNTYGRVIAPNGVVQGGRNNLRINLCRECAMKIALGLLDLLDRPEIEPVR